jgi:hypothetical protein
MRAMRAMRALRALRALLTCCAVVGSAFLIASCSKAQPDEHVLAEIHARQDYAKRMLLTEDAGRTLSVASSPDIMFEEGFSMISTNPPENFRAHAVRWMGQNAHVRLRAHPGRRMKLHFGGWVNESVIKAHPFMTVYLDGERIGTVGPIQLDHYWFDVVLPPEKLHREWVDLNIRTNAIAFHWGDPPTLTVVQIYNFKWEPTDDPATEASSGP